MGDRCVGGRGVGDRGMGGRVLGGRGVGGRGVGAEVRRVRLEGSEVRRRKEWGGEGAQNLGVSFSKGEVERGTVRGNTDVRERS